MIEKARLAASALALLGTSPYAMAALDADQALADCRQRAQENRQSGTHALHLVRTCILEKIRAADDAGDPSATSTSAPANQ